jgi:hypothetical protein
MRCFHSCTVATKHNLLLACTSCPQVTWRALLPEAMYCINPVPRYTRRCITVIFNGLVPNCDPYRDLDVYIWFQVRELRIHSCSPINLVMLVTTCRYFVARVVRFHHGSSLPFLPPR